MPQICLTCDENQVACKCDANVRDWTTRYSEQPTMDLHAIVCDMERALQEALPMKKDLVLVDCIIRPGQAPDAPFVGVVWWSQRLPEGATGFTAIRPDGTHAFKLNTAGSWDFYWGHYDLTKQAARDDFNQRAERTARC